MGLLGIAWRVCLVLIVVYVVVRVVIWGWGKIKGTSVGNALPDSIESFLNTVSGAAVKVTDVADVVSSYLSLTAIRKLACVQEDPKAMEATDYLRGVITAWKRPEEEDVVSVAPTIESLTAEVAALKAEKAVAAKTTTSGA